MQNEIDMRIILFVDWFPFISECDKNNANIHNNIYLKMVMRNALTMYVHSYVRQDITPVRARGLSRECAPPYPQRDRKRRLGAVCRNHRIKRLVPCRC